MKSFVFVLEFLVIANSQTIVNIKTVPLDVTVFLNSIEIGESPINTTRIDTGRHTFRFEKKGFVTSSGEVIIAPAKLLDIDVRLIPLHNIIFKAEDEGLVFEWDDTHKWTHKKIRFEMQEGTHILKVFRDRELVDEQRLKITRPQTIEYRLPVEGVDSLETANISVEE